MTKHPSPDEIFFTHAGLDRARTERIVADALSGCDDGELFLEYRQSESFAFDDGKLKSASFDSSQGFRILPLREPVHARGLGRGCCRTSAIPN